MTTTYATGKHTISNGGYQAGYGPTPPAGNVTIATNSIGAVGSTVSIFGGGGGGSGQVYTTNTTAGQFLTSATNGTSWANPNDNVMIVKQDPASLEVKGKMILNGQDLEERLNTIEKVLCIPERDIKLEKKHPKLKKLYDDYINALGKYRTFESIKGDEE